MIDFEAWKQVLGTDGVNIGIGQIKKLMMASDRSVLRVLVSVFPEQREIICRMTWDAVGPEAGFFTLPSVGDLVLIAVADREEELPFVISRLTSKEDKIPTNAADGHSVLKALAGKAVWITSDTKINLSAGDSAPTENVVLGQVFKSFMTDLLDYIINHTHIGNQGYSTSPPENASDFTSIKSDPIENDNILSDLAFTEKGGS